MIADAARNPHPQIMPMRKLRGDIMGLVFAPGEAEDRGAGAADQRAQAAGFQQFPFQLCAGRIQPDGGRLQIIAQQFCNMM